MFAPPHKPVSVCIVVVSECVCVEMDVGMRCTIVVTNEMSCGKIVVEEGSGVS